MDSITKIYRTGHGPSSSHTIGPGTAASNFKGRTPDAASYRVTLFGSLGATGKGHMTDKVIIEELSPKPAEIVWKGDIVPAYHTNGVLFEALDKDGKVQQQATFYSVGGGEVVEGPMLDAEGQSDGTVFDAQAYNSSSHVYKHNTCTEIQSHLKKHGTSFWEYVEYCEEEQIWDYLRDIWETMQKSIHEGLDNDRVLPGGLNLKSKAKQYYTRAFSLKDVLRRRTLVMAYAMAVSENNARGGIVVTAPTCGSCGVLPSVLYFLKTEFEIPDNDIIKALATAGLFGNMIKTNASLSGAEVGCQGEVGSACVMAATAATQILGGTPIQIECAAEMAMEHNLGLTCDPVCGLVQIPCIERNMTAALRALDVSIFATVGDGSHAVPFDKVIETMKKTGKDLPSLYKETSLGGLATVGIND